MLLPRSVQALLLACIFLSAAVLSTLAMNSAASKQMAEKRRISLQLREDMEQCGNLAGADERFCRLRAQGRAELANAELQAHRHALRQARRHHTAVQRSANPARCDALAHALHGQCVNASSAPETS